ncbi:outer membrane lipoprotein LolB [Glaciimonas sp. PAMC28666]|uniref:outer membrane lipoprotein LolB n=1 Tax=Glaciimonas sp. PAMC28666 TaxID=2807626 RepID=UPI001964F314|nr:outer membrane lipoprotein LolB [Glaciimonas sp. PAMC28666]QRX84662.1 outer membrane lipoprotein LolB [Glaciimonas sp. PAMC28666]
MIAIGARALSERVASLTKLTTFSLIGVVFTALTIGGCATFTQPAVPVTVTANNDNATRLYHQAIDFSGRLSVRYQQDGKEQALHGSFTWAQTSQHTLVTLLSPLGQTLATIDITPQQSTLHQAGQPSRTAADVDLLTAQALGWPLPIAGLREWLQGFGAGANGKPFSVNPTVSGGVSTVTTADRWSIQYDTWQPIAVQAGSANSAQSGSLPKRIDLTRNTAQAGDVAIRIVIDSAQPH